MKWICKCCSETIERKMDVYSNPYLLDPLWLHLKKQHKEKYEQMMDFENPYDIIDLYMKECEKKAATIALPFPVPDYLGW